MNPFFLKYISRLLPLAIAGTVQAQLLNGDFQTGNLTGWTTFTTASGNIGSFYSLPNVISFDVTGTGTPSNAAQFQVGQPSFIPGSYQGGGIFQTFNLSSAGQYSVSLDIAASFNGRPGVINNEAGLFTLSMDGTTLNTVDFGAITNGSTLRSNLFAITTLSTGPHQLTIEMTRPFVNGGGYANTPLEFLDNIQVTPVPEPSELLLTSVGLLLLLTFHKSRLTRLVAPKFDEGGSRRAIAI